jgi:hypothetical protein
MRIRLHRRGPSVKILICCELHNKIADSNRNVTCGHIHLAFILQEVALLHYPFEGVTD